MIFTFYKARGMGVGSSLVEDDSLELAKKLEGMAKEKGVEFILPTDVIVADKFDAAANTQTVPVESIPEGWMVRRAFRVLGFLARTAPHVFPTLPAARITAFPRGPWPSHAPVLFSRASCLPMSSLPTISTPLLTRRPCLLPRAEWCASINKGFRVSLTCRPICGPLRLLPREWQSSKALSSLAPEPVVPCALACAGEKGSCCLNK